MRIGLFTDSYPPFINGVSTSIETLKKSLEKKGHVVYIVTVGQDATTYSYDEDNRILKVPGIPLGIYDYRAASIYPIRVINKIKSWKLDIIHSHTELCMGIFARLIAKQFGIPLVHTCHTMYKDYTYYVSRNHKILDLGCKKAIEYLSVFYCDLTANAFVVPTVKTYKVFRDEYKYDKDIYIVPTGIDSKRFYLENMDLKKLEETRKSLKYKKNDFVIVFVGRMAQEKNVEFLLNMMTKVKNKNIKLMIIGDGPDKEKYEEINKSLKLEDKVKFIGSVVWEEMPYYYHCADALITASLTETQGLTVIEAMASSLPAICIEDEAFHTMVIDGLNGRFFNNEKECVKILEEISKDKKQMKILSNQALLASKKFTPSEFAKNTLEVYNSAINNYNNKKDIISVISRIMKKKKEDKNVDSTE